MRVMSNKPAMIVLMATGVLSMTGSLSAQPQDSEAAAPKSPITVNGASAADMAPMAVGPEIKGFISARSGNRLQVTSSDGSKSTIALTDTTIIKASKGIFGSNRMEAGALLNGLPVTVKTLQAGDGLLASQILLRNGDLKMANMVRHGTDQRFAEQSAATEALRGRMADIDNYNVKSTINVHFDTGKAVLSAQDKAQLCATASQAEGVNNALMLVVGYTDATGSDDFNQTLSEKRAGSVINYLQQACRWKPYRMLTPTGMAKADPLASNDTPEGKAQNRRVSVNILVSKAVDGV